LVVWVALLTVAIWLMYTRRPLYVPAAPVVAWLIWLGVPTAGQNWLGWTG
jgi:hypothetical protein